MGRTSDECGVSFRMDVADPPHSPASRLPQDQRRAQVFGMSRYLWETSEVTRAANAVCHPPLMLLTHRIRQQAGSHRCDARHNICGTTHYPVGDVRGYEGIGRTSDECGVSFSMDVADPPHSPASRLPQMRCPPQHLRDDALPCGRRPRLRGYGPHFGRMRCVIQHGCR
jgi:hypothetical protein